MLNHITIMGRMTRDPELRYTQSQTPVCSFSIACDRDRKNANGTVDFIDCTAWRHTAEFVSQYFKKGTLAVVVGRLQIRDWIDKDGSKRKNAEINVENVYFGESKRKADSDERSPMPGDKDAPPVVANTPPSGIDELARQFPDVVRYDEIDDEFPF